MGKILTPFIATHPGIVLRKELVARHITQRKFSEMINMQPTMLNEIITGKRPITAAIAISLEKALEISAEFWIKFQYQYELDMVRQKESTIHRLQQIEEKKLAGLKVTPTVNPVSHRDQSGSVHSD